MYIFDRDLPHWSLSNEVHPTIHATITSQKNSVQALGRQIMCEDTLQLVHFIA